MSRSIIAANIPKVLNHRSKTRVSHSIHLSNYAEKYTNFGLLLLIKSFLFQNVHSGVEKESVKITSLLSFFLHLKNDVYTVYNNAPHPFGHKQTHRSTHKQTSSIKMKINIYLSFFLTLICSWNVRNNAVTAVYVETKAKKRYTS